MLEDSTKLGVSEWPSFFPKDVPPADAVDAEGRAFRLVRGIPSAPGDFLSTFEENPGREHGDHFWMACGASLHTKLEGSQKTRQRYKPLRERRIAVGVLNAEHGKMKPTPGFHPSHITVWFRVGATPHLSFVDDAEAAT